MSATPEPMPIVSTAIWLGASPQLRIASFTRPATSTTSHWPNTICGYTTRPLRNVMQLLSLPKRATSTPTISGPMACTSAGPRRMASSTTSPEIQALETDAV